MRFALPCSLHAFALRARWIGLCLAVAIAAWGGPASAAPESAEVAQARELLDTYYGNRATLDRAVLLLKGAYQRNPKDAKALVQAARAVAMGGQLDFDGMINTYGALLDAALALDASDPKAHILKSEVFWAQSRLDDQLRELEAAKALGTDDPWLQIEYGRYFRRVGREPEMFQAFTRVIERGPGRTASDRRAFVQAIWELHDEEVAGEDSIARQRRLAALALRERHPADAWTPTNWAGHFLKEGLYDDAIAAAQAALRTSSIAAARAMLALGLYAKAAELVTAGSSTDAPPVKALVTQAQSLGVSREQLLTQRTSGPAAVVRKYGPLLDRLMR